MEATIWGQKLSKIFTVPLRSLMSSSVFRISMRIHHSSSAPTHPILSRAAREILPYNFVEYERPEGGGRYNKQSMALRGDWLSWKGGKLEENNKKKTERKHTTIRFTYCGRNNKCSWSGRGQYLFCIIILYYLSPFFPQVLRIYIFFQFASR